MPCTKKKPPTILEAAFLVPVRTMYYSLSDNGYEIDQRVMGVCNDCYKGLNEFQKKNKTTVDINHSDLVNKLA